MYRLRLKIFLSIVVALILVAIGRLVHLQLLLGDYYRYVAEDSLVPPAQTLPTVRGRILDRHGRVLAVDRACYDFCLKYGMLTGDRRWVRRQLRRIVRTHGVTDEQAREIYRRKVEQTWRLAEEITGTSRNEMARIAERTVRRILAIRRRVGQRIREENWSHPIITGLDEATAVALRSRLDEMIGASVRPSHTRWYPYGQAACHLIGRVGPVSAEQLERMAGESDDRDSISGYLLGDLIGVAGVEKACEDSLRGRRGRRRVRYDGQIIKELPARLGRDVHLTLDIKLQRELAKLLSRPGAIIVLDVPTGEVLAAVSLPTYDLNRYRRDFQRLIADEADLPLLDRALRGRYPPGSTVKPLVALAGLASGKISAQSTFNCRGYLHHEGAFRCWIWKYRVGHGDLDVLHGIQQSCNVFFYRLGERLGVRRLRHWFGEFGFAETPGTHLPGESPGRLPDPRRVIGSGTARNLGIGQGPVAVTPMHVANAMATIARDGEFLSPLLVRELADRRRRRRLEIPPDALSLVRRGMFLVVNSSRGTAKQARHPDVEICGKTGTAETAPRRVGGREVRRGDTAWFAGFAPYRNPRIAFAVMVEYSDAGGGPTCGPIARQVVEICRRFGYLEPLDGPGRGASRLAGPAE